MDDKGYSLNMKKYILNGKKIKNLNEFFQEFSKMINSESSYFGKDMDSFDDCFFGGYGITIPCVIIWKNSAVSKKNLGYEALVKWCQEQLDKSNYLDENGLNYLMQQRENAKNNFGVTLFDEIVSRILSVKSRSNGKINIELILE
ncbi:MAG: barstar family protein [Oligoflexia bacterium]|nr:barstar family protein [Oligoflexia bacterium]MBF0365025.1 barstar family protein [Oligoflexia bacterium]